MCTVLNNEVITVGSTIVFNSTCHSTVITSAIFMCSIWLSSYVCITVDETPKADVTVHSEYVISVILYILLCPSVNCIINMTSQRGIVGQRMGASVRTHRPVGDDTCCDFPFYVPLPCYWHNSGWKWVRSSRADCLKSVKILDALSLWQESVYHCSADSSPGTQSAENLSSYLAGFCLELIAWWIDEVKALQMNGSYILVCQLLTMFFLRWKSIIVGFPWLWNGHACVSCILRHFV